MTHADVLKSLGDSHADRAEKIGCGCQAHNVRDWMRRKGIPAEWLAHVAAAHPSVTVDQLADMIAVKPEAA